PNTTFRGDSTCVNELILNQGPAAFRRALSSLLLSWGPAGCSAPDTPRRRASWRSWALAILPVPSLGSSSTTFTTRGALKWAMWSRHHATSSYSNGDPGEAALRSD